MKNRHIWVSIVAVIFFSFLLSGDRMARYTWANYRNARIALALDRSDGKLGMEIGNYYFNGGDYNLRKAEAGFERAIAIDPKISFGHYQLARVYFVERKLPEALLEINKELGASPENLRSLYIRGLINATKGDLAAAENDFKRFTLWAPNEWAGYNDLAWVYSKEGKYEEAAKTILKALSEVHYAQNNPWLKNSLGVAYLNLKKYGEARAAFREAGKLAGELSLDEWKKAYPGNDNKTALAGLTAFRSAIAENLRRASFVDNSL